MRLTFEEGTLLLRDYKGDEAPPAFVWDARVDLFRAQAHFYRESLDYLKRESITFKNTAPRYQTLSLSQQSPPRPAPAPKRKYHRLDTTRPTRRRRATHRLRQIAGRANGHARSPAQHAYRCSDHRPDEPMV
ncbi:MAG: hypothetical protein OSB73_01380 [Candidatus Latescibacteria bacterium]|nr:hypothetical protein [Candidatus Latescibacterota bacterium]